MKDIPILFSAPMIRAIIAGTKTQTRRALKPQSVKYYLPKWSIGDRLWVREQFSGPYHCAGIPPRDWSDRSAIWYWADGNPPDGNWARPKPSIHMPRWASRITLEVTGVRVERLQSINEADALAEGAPDDGPMSKTDPISWFRSLWDTINGPGSWGENPWVCVIEFRRVPKIDAVWDDARALALKRHPNAPYPQPADVKDALTVLEAAMLEAQAADTAEGRG